MDKTGAVCEEQILYTRALADDSKLCRALGADYRSWEKKASELGKAVFENFWDEERKVFFDSYESGQRKVTRQTNILAYLYLNCTEDQKNQIYKNVLL